MVSNPIYWMGNFIHREGSPLPQLETRGGARLTQSRMRKSPLKKAFFTLYNILVVLSAIIVGIYCIWNLLVKPPEIDNTPPAASSVQTPMDPADTSTDLSTPEDDPAVPEEPVPVRREGVYTFALLGKDKESGNTDTIIVVTYDTVEQNVGMVSIPRDTVVKRSWSSNPKINGAYAMSGPDTLKEEIENTFGIPIDFYIWINLDGFIAMVDLLGGVDVYIPEDMNYDDPYQDLHIHYTKGNWHLNGQQAMEVVRFRHNNDADGGGGYNDEGRAAMQRQVLTALAKKVISLNSITKVNQYLDVFRTYVKTDLSASDMAWFATKALGVDLSTGIQQGALTGRSDAYYKGYSWCYTYKAEDILPTLNELLNPYDMDLTAEDLDLPKASGYYFNY